MPALEEIMKLIDNLSKPGKMTKSEAFELLENIEAELQGRMEALRDEMEEE